MGWLGEGVIIALVVFVLLPIVSLYLRRRWLSSRGGVFDCGHRDAPDGGWMLGLARYNGDVLEWYRVFSVSLRPKLVLDRRSLELGARRRPSDVEALALFEASEVVTLRTRHLAEPVELAMSTGSVLGLMSWIEAGPRQGSTYPGVE